MQAASIPAILYTDHKALLSILQGESSSTRIGGWQLRLGEYNLDIVHVKGTENGLADGLSRIPIRVLDIGIIGKEQSYLSTMAVVHDDIGGFTLRERGNKGIQAVDGCAEEGESTKRKGRVESTVCSLSQSDGREKSDGREQSDGGFLGDTEKKGEDVEKKEENTENRMELRKRWQSWIEEDWYKEVVWFRLFGLTNEEKESHQLVNRIRRQTASFCLAERNGSASLVFVERNGSQSWCVRPTQVQSVLSLSRQSWTLLDRDHSAQAHRSILAIKDAGYSRVLPVMYRLPILWSMEAFTNGSTHPSSNTHGHAGNGLSRSHRAKA